MFQHGLFGVDTTTMTRQQLTPGIAATRLRTLVAVSLAMIAVLALAVVPVSAATTITGLSPITYTEGAGPVTIAPNAVVTESGSFADGYVEFSIAGATSTESLTLPTVSTPDPTSGAVSVVGGAVFLGLGSGAYKQIGTVDAVKNGLAGQALRVNFSAVLPNGDFSGAATGGTNAVTPSGWTVNRNYLALGALATKSQGNPVIKTGSGPFTITGSGYSFETDENFDPGSRAEWGYESKERGVTAATYNSTVGAYSGRADSLRLWFNGTCPGPNDTSYCAAFGPEAFSSTFAAKAGDSLAFDWAAANGSDNYEVYGFLVNQDTSASTELMYGRGGTKAWTTASGTIPVDGNYKFRFVAGSYDKTGGFAIGASLYIDNVRVLSNDVTAAVAQSVTRLVQYQNTSDNPTTPRTITVTTAVAGGTPASETVTNTVTPVDDPPVIGTVTTSTFTNTIATDTFATATGTLPGTDPEGDAITYGLIGGTAGSTVVGGITYDLSRVGTYGTAYVASATGAWAFVPDATAINNRLTADTESFAVTATANGLAGTGSIPIAVSIPASVAGAPTTLAGTPGNAAADLTWVGPIWLGGSAITGYKVEKSTDGTTWSTAIANTSSATPSAQVTGLTNGTLYQFRVSAINTTGIGAVSTTAPVTPGAAPGAPTSPSASPGDRQATVSWTAPVDDGGRAITGYKIETSIDAGSTWTTSVANTGSTSTTTVVTSLTNGAPTTFRISAINVLGTSGPSPLATAVPRTIPDAPTGLGVTPGNGWVVASWTAPASNGGSAITGYKVETSTDGLVWTVAIADTGSTSTSALIGSQPNGTPVRVRVSAINVAGTSVPSTQATGTPRTTPGAPTITAVTPGNRQLTVAFTPPTDNGGAAITNYEYSVDGGTTWVVVSPVTTTGPVVINRLANGDPITVQLRAINPAGSGAAATGSPATPAAMPVVPAGSASPSTGANGGSLLVDGVEQPLVVTDTSDLPGNTSPEGTLRVSGGGVTVDLLARDESGAANPLDDNGNLQLVMGASTQVSGSGFRPGSTVDVWLMPGSILLGNVTVGADGKFSASLAVPAGLTVGDHTIQINGVGADGGTRSVTLDASVRGATEERTPSLLAFTGGSALGMMQIAATMMLVGFVLDRRRRRTRAL